MTVETHFLTVMQLIESGARDNQRKGNHGNIHKYIRYKNKHDTNLNKTTLWRRLRLQRSCADMERSDQVVFTVRT